MPESEHAAGSRATAPDTAHVQASPLVEPDPALAQLTPTRPGHGLGGLLSGGDRATRARVVTALQRTHGNAAVGRLIGSMAPPTRPLARTPGPFPSRPIAQDRLSSRRPAHRVLARYSHTDCEDDVLKSHVWPADYHAREMTAKALRAVSADPVAPEVAALFRDFFMTDTPRLISLQLTFHKLDSFFRRDEYRYECEDECDPTAGGEPKAAYVYRSFPTSEFSNIHICVPNLGEMSPQGVGRDIVHELIHTLRGWDDVVYCLPQGCAEHLTADEAITNPDSYANFALAVYNLPLQV